MSALGWIALAAYVVVGVCLGYLAGRETYRRDPLYRGKTGPALFSWALFGALWPMLLLFAGFDWLRSQGGWDALGRRLFG